MNSPFLEFKKNLVPQFANDIILLLVLQIFRGEREIAQSTLSCDTIVEMARLKCMIIFTPQPTPTD